MDITRTENLNEKENVVENKPVDNLVKPVEKKLNKFKIICPFYNCAQFLDNCIASILTQNYEGEFSVLFIDDASLDNGFRLIPSVVFKTDEQGNTLINEKGEPIVEYKHPLLEHTKCKEVKLWRSSERRTALPNIHNAIMNFCDDPDDIVILCDADDFLTNRNVLNTINDNFNETGCWFQYGGAIWSTGQKCCSSEYSREEFERVRTAPFRVSHLRAFYAGLYKSIGIQDPDWKCMKDKNGDFWRSCYDVPMCLAMLEMSSFEKINHNKKVLYHYTRHPNNDDAIDQNLQTSIHIETTKRPSFKKIKDYRTGEIA